MKEINLIKATTDDIPKLIFIENKLVGLKTYIGMRSENEWREEFNKGSIIYLILNDDKVVGNISYEIKLDGSTYISGFAIDPEFQGQGIGKQAMQMILKNLENVKIIDLVTHPENDRAIKLYESLGFKKVGEPIENYFGDGQPRIKMILEK